MVLLKVSETFPDIKIFMTTPTLPESSFPLVEFVNHVNGDERERGYCEEPANSVCPPRIHICVIKLQGTVLDQREDKGALQDTIDKNVV